MTEIELLPREHDEPTKCPMCSYRTTLLWNLGADEREEYAACGDCTTRHIASNDEFTVHKETSKTTADN